MRKVDQCLKFCNYETGFTLIIVLGTAVAGGECDTDTLYSNLPSSNSIAASC